MDISSLPVPSREHLPGRVALFAIGVVCALVLSASAASSARADGEGQSAPTLTKPKPSGAQPNAYGGAANYTVNGSLDWFILKNNSDGSGYVVGNVKKGTTVSLFYKPSNSDWAFARSTASGSGCAWMDSGNATAPGGTPAGCGTHADISPSTFMAFYNGNTDNFNCNSGGCWGNYTHLTSACDAENGGQGTTFYANAPNGLPNVPATATPMGGGRYVKDSAMVRWRYVTPDKQYTMIQVAEVVGQQNWGFIRTDCISTFTGTHFTPPALGQGRNQDVSCTPTCDTGLPGQPGGGGGGGGPAPDPPPPPDADGDGVIDVNDWCMNKIGVTSNHGCPPEGQTSNAAVYRENIDGVNMFYPQTSGVLALVHLDSNLPNSWVLDTFPGTSVVGAPSSIHRSNGDVMSFFRGSDSLIHVTWLNHATNGWATATVGGPAAGAPSAVERSVNGDVHAFYRGTDGHLHDAWLSGTTWHDQYIGGDAAGDPAILDRTSNGQLHVFYRSVSGAIYDVWLSGSTWTNSYIGGAGDPAPMYRWDNGDIHVFYRATSGAMNDAVLSGGSWANWVLGGTPAGKIAPLFRGPLGDLHAFYKSTDGYLHDMWMNAGTNSWADATIAGPTAGIPSPVSRDKNSDLHVFYVRSNGNLYDAWLSGTSWHDQYIGAGAVPTN
jgi:hypothetical protein